MLSTLISTPHLTYLLTLLPYLYQTSPPPSNPIYPYSSLSTSPPTSLLTLLPTPVTTLFLTPVLRSLPISDKSSKVVSYYCIYSSRILKHKFSIILTTEGFILLTNIISTIKFKYNITYALPTTAQTHFPHLLQPINLH